MENTDLEKVAKMFSLVEGYVKKLPVKEYSFVAPTTSESVSSNSIAENLATSQSNSDNFDASNSIAENLVTSQSATTNLVAREKVQTENPAYNLSDIQLNVQNCRACKLCENRTNTVPGMGVQNPIVLVIGEGPGEAEDKSGLPFVGAAGQLLDKMLAAINLNRETNTYIANIVKCRPPHNRDPELNEIKTCIHFLEAQIKILSPRAILLLGRIATETILNNKSGITRLHGNFFEYNGIPVMPTYHPSALLRNQDLKRPAWEDLKTFRQKLDSMGVNL